jgi:capsular exopolysaccharide synthesis family protein
MVQYNNDAIEVKNETNRKILAFINDRLQLVERQLDSVEGNFQNFRTNRQVIDMAAQSEMYFGDVNKITENVRSQEVQLQVVKLLQDYISQPANRLTLVPSTLGLTDPTLLKLTEAYNKLVADRMSELETGATVDNPVVKSIDRNIDEARVKMLQSLRNIEQVYRRNIQTLNAESGTIKKEISSIPEKERMSREKARQQEIKQNLYLYLLQKREESEIARASTIANSRILDTALPVSNKISPVAFKVYGLCLLIGLVVPVVIIYIRDLLSDKVTTKSDITKVTDAPVLGEIGHSENEHVLLFPNSSRTIVAEQMRILRSNLRFVLGDKFENPTILVTSSFSGEGKSFISTNLGATLAISGKRTVILEFDLRKPKILVGLDLPKGHGLTNYLVGGASFEEIIQPVPVVDNLFVIPCGPVPPNPSEILLTPKIAELFRWLKQNYDAVVIDTAPVGLVSDAFTLSQYADSTIYVVRQRYTFKKQVSFIDELYRDKKLPNIGLLVNDVVAKGSRGYYGYGGGRYGYGYGYGYSYIQGYYLDEDKKNGKSKPNIGKYLFNGASKNPSRKKNQQS